MQYNSKVDNSQACGSAEKTPEKRRDDAFPGVIKVMPESYCAA